MKTKVPVSKKHLSRKNRARYYFNYHTALQLYAFYKAETIIKNEPRIPLNDSRRPVPPHKRRLSLVQYLIQQIISCISSIKESGSNPHHAAVSPEFSRSNKRLNNTNKTKVDTA